MVSKSELEEKLALLDNASKEYETRQIDNVNLFNDSTFLNYLVSGCAFGAFLMYGKHGITFSQEEFSLAKLGFVVLLGCAGTYGVVNIFLSVFNQIEKKGVDYLREERDKLQTEYDLMSEDYTFSRGHV